MNVLRLSLILRLTLTDGNRKVSDSCCLKLVYKEDMSEDVERIPLTVIIKKMSREEPPSASSMVRELTRVMLSGSLDDVKRYMSENSVPSGKGR